MRDLLAQLAQSEFETHQNAGQIEKRGGLRIYSQPYPHRPGHHLVKMWSGKQRKPFYNYLVKNERVEAVIAEAVASEEARAARKASWKEDAKKQKAANSAAYAVGTILHGSWGYDQTNAELYEIVERPSAGFVVIRELAANSESSGPMAGYVTPIPGQYVGPPLRKAITAHGIKLHSSCTLTPTNPEAKHYSSWYA